MLSLKMKTTEEWEDYFGFTLKNGMFYGEDTETGDKVAVTGWENPRTDFAVYYKLPDGNWKAEWYMYGEIEIEVSNLDEILAPITREGKMSFRNFIETHVGVTWEYYDNNYSGSDEWYNYQYYLYDGLPSFMWQYCEDKCKKEGA